MRIRFFSLVLLFTIFTVLGSQHIVAAGDISKDFKVIGNITWAGLESQWKGGATLASEPSLKYLTHLIGPAVVPTSLNNPVLKGMYGDVHVFTYISNAAHSNRLKAIPYIFGSTTDLATIISNGKLDVMIESIRDLLVNYNLDGIELDFEATVDVDQTSYGILVDSLYPLLRPIGKTISVAGMSGKWQPNINVSEIPKIDWIDVMTYDLTVGGYKHSTYNNSIEVIQKWIGWGFPADKMNVGIPFYGYNQTKTTVYKYRDFADAVSPTPVQDEGVINGEKVWCSGVTTCKNKAQWSVQNNLGGIFMFAINYDKLNCSCSLLKNIYDEVYSNNSTVPH